MPTAQFAALVAFPVNDLRKLLVFFLFFFSLVLPPLQHDMI